MTEGVVSTEPNLRSTPPVLDAGGCHLRPWQASDLDALLRHADDPVVSRFLRDRFPWPYTRADGEWFLADCQQLEDEWRLAIEVDGEAVGGIGLRFGQAEERASAEVGYWLGRSRWGRGLARAAVAALVDHAFAVLPLHRIHTTVYAGNPASMRVLEHCGFQREGVLRAAIIKRGELAPRRSADSAPLPIAGASMSRSSSSFRTVGMGAIPREGALR